MDLPVFLPRKVVEDTAEDLSRFGAEVISKQVLDWTSDAERNVPYVRGICSFLCPVFFRLKPSVNMGTGSGRDAFGQRTDELVTSEGWRSLQTMGLKEG